MSSLPADQPRPLQARRVRFAWDATPMHWVPGDAETTHIINVLHLLLPAGERWFVEVYKEALPLITDDRLRADVRGFMGQEAVHARAHAAVLEHLNDLGLDPAPFTRRIDWLFGTLLAAERAPLPLRRHWLKFRLAVIATIEHYTCVLGGWILQARALDEAGADPVMMDLLRWHGAEEVEHRSVAFDTFEHLGGRGRYRMRVEATLLTVPIMGAVWHLGSRYLLSHDPTLPGHPYRLRQFVRAARQGRIPSWELIRAVPRYLAPSYHPSRELSAKAAMDYLAVSPAATAAASAASAGLTE
jgi:predicted metal-dependent hydrolase